MQPVRLMQGRCDMAERPRFFDDLAGVAGGAISALAGLREEFEAEFREQLRAAYPAGRHGTVLPFRRVFAVAHRVGS